VFALDYPTTMCSTESSILDKYFKGVFDHIVGYIIAMPTYTVCICCKICFHANTLYQLGHHLILKYTKWMLNALKMQNVYISQPNGYKVDFDNMLKLMQG
jgi:hypothetical protein